jgi:hypothetical protein
MAFEDGSVRHELMKSKTAWRHQSRNLYGHWVEARDVFHHREGINKVERALLERRLTAFRRQIKQFSGFKPNLLEARASEVEPLAMNLQTECLVT